VKRALVWIRRDLRLHDHAALSAATHEADEVAVVFVFDCVILDALADKDDRRLTYICRSLEEVDAKLRGHGSRLLVMHGDPVSLIPSLAREWNADAVFANRDYEPYARERDAKVAAQVELRTFKDIVVLEPHEVATKEGSPFKVFTPFHRCWKETLNPEQDLAEHVPNLSRLAALSTLKAAGFLEQYPQEKIGFVPNALWLEPGEKAARTQLKRFVEKRLDGYAEARNLPADDGTSALSVHLRFGTVSIREGFRLARQSIVPNAPKTNREAKSNHFNPATGPEKWMAELVWREFYQHILWHFPRVVEEPFQEQYRGLRWQGTDEHFARWCEGQTGYPLVDAAMRCLNQTGYMHNRLRMVVASFLTKDLLVDYRKGEAYFARKLLDFDLASNNGGWQWAASTGVDPQPYFRIFNPVTQGEKFDPEGRFIRRWIPELRELSASAIHAPWEAVEMELLAAGVELGRTYPRPIVDHAVQRNLAIELLSKK